MHEAREGAEERGWRRHELMNQHLQKTVDGQREDDIHEQSRSTNEVNP